MPICLLPARNTSQQQSERMEKDIHVDVKQKTAGVAILITQIIDFNIKTVNRDKEGLFIITKGPIWQENVIVVSHAI